MNIGTLAKETGLAQSRIRYYEAQGLLGPVQRSANGYRVYSPETSYTLSVITAAQDAGFSLDEMRHFLPAGAAGWDRVKLAESLTIKLGEIAVIQARLARTRGDIEALLNRIERDTPGDECFKGASLKRV